MSARGYGFEFSSQFAAPPRVSLLGPILLPVFRYAFLRRIFGARA
jgi:hypothetical protein